MTGPSIIARYLHRCGLLRRDPLHDFTEPIPDQSAWEPAITKLGRVIVRGRPAWPTGIGATTSRAFVGGPGRGGARGRAATGHVSQGVHRWLAATNRTSPSGCHCDATAMTEGSRRFPPPWRADKTPHGYVVRDANGQAIAYIYSRENEAEARRFGRQFRM